MKSRSRAFGVLFGAGFCFAFSQAGAGVVPDGFPVERYAPLWERSPFTISSVQQAPVQANFAQNLVVVATARIGSMNLVTLANKINLERLTVTSAPDAQGLRVVSVVTNPDPMKTQVTLQKANEVATVGFDKAFLTMTQTPPPPVVNARAQTPAGASAEAPAATPPQNPALRRRSLPIPVPPRAASPASAPAPPPQ